MPGFILHLTAAQMLLKHLPSHPDFPYPISSVNDFLIGNLLPDATQQKESSHFRDPLYREKMMVFPDLTRFTAKYRSLLPDSSALGYYFHLYIDRKFFKDFIPQIVEFYNADGEITDMRDEIATVYIKKSRTSIPFSRYLTEEYYYGDYTRMNTYLVNRYCIPLDLNPNVTNPGITEIQYENVQQVLDLLHHFLSVPPEAAQDLKVFPLEELLAALEQYVEEFLAVPNNFPFKKEQNPHRIPLLFQNVIFPFSLTLPLERSLLCHPYPFVFFFDIPSVSSHNIS